MPDPATYLSFLAAVLAYQLSGPGPDMMLVISRGIGQGWQAALWAAFGCVAAGIVQIPMLAFGLALLMASSPLAFELLRLVGAGYVIYVGFKLLTSGGKEKLVGQEATIGSIWVAFRQGMICNLTNPNTLMFMLAILPQFVRPSEGPAAPQLLILGATMKASGLVVLGSVALASGALGGLIGRHRSFVLWLERFAGIVMVAFGIRLLVGGQLGAAGK